MRSDDMQPGRYLPTFREI